MRRLPRRVARILSVVLVVACSAAPGWSLASEIAKLLGESEYVYIASTRKDGSLGKPAEIWFLFHENAVYVGTSPTSWRVRRIGWGRPQAKIWVGKVDGPSFTARGEVVDDDKVEQLMLERYAEKYPAGWERHAASFRDGFKSGKRVVVKYVAQE